MRVRVLLVDDDALVRAGLSMILSSAEDLEVVGEADDGSRAVAAVRQHRPDVVLMDIRMPEMDGITATAALCRLDAPPHVIVLTTFQADEPTRRLATLTDREREVALAVGSGASNAEVASSLFMSEATVKAHVSRLLAKLDVANRVHIAIVVHDAHQP